MIRIPDTQESLGQARVQNNINQYSTSQDFVDAGLRPDLGPTDTIPMSITTDWQNPGEAELLKKEEITPLTPAGAHSTDVYPEVYPAPDDTTDLTYEDQYPTPSYRGDQVLRSRSGYRGPAQYWKYGGMAGPTEGDPIFFNVDPSEVAYQTYPGPMLGSSLQIFDTPPPDYYSGIGQIPSAAENVTPALITTAIGALLALAGPMLVSGEHKKLSLIYMGSFAGALGLVNLVTAVTK